MYCVLQEIHYVLNMKFVFIIAEIASQITYELDSKDIPSFLILQILTYNIYYSIYFINPNQLPPKMGQK